MSLSSDDKAWRGRFKELTDREQRAYQAAFDHIHSFGVAAAEDERTARLEAAMVRYLIESRLPAKA